MLVRLVSASLVAALALVAPQAQAMPEFKCNKTVKIKKAIVGLRGEYTIKKGLSTSKRTGFLNRKTIKPTKKCLFAGLQSDQCVVLHLTKKGFEKLKGLKLQCVDPAGKMLRGRGKGALGYSMGGVDFYEFLLFGKNKTGYPSDSGDNSTRTKKLKTQLAKKGLIMTSFCVPRAETKFAKAIGKKIFCQWYHEKSESVVFATEYTFLGPKK